MRRSSVEDEDGRKKVHRERALDGFCRLKVPRRKHQNSALVVKTTQDLADTSSKFESGCGTLG